MRVRLPSILETSRTRRGPSGVRFSRSLLVASATAALAFAAIALLVPLREQIVVRVPLPERVRTIVLPEPLPEPPVAAVPPPPRVDDLTVTRVIEKPVPPGTPDPFPPRERPRIDPDRGQAGRQRAREATADLERATAALDEALGDLSSALGADAAAEPGRRRPRRARGGRSAAELAAFDAGDASRGAAADLDRSRVAASSVAIGSLTPTRLEEVSRAADLSSVGAPPGVHRTNASLLAVIQRYAAGIQYCYATELKKSPGLAGKLTVTLTVAASGEVVDALVVRNTVGSERLEQCALSQIRQWKFPAIAEGLTTFQVPFVFTPPD